MIVLDTLLGTWLGAIVGATLGELGRTPLRGCDGDVLGYAPVLLLGVLLGGWDGEPLG